MTLEIFFPLSQHVWCLLTRFLFLIFINFLSSEIPIYRIDCERKRKWRGGRGLRTTRVRQRYSIKNVFFLWDPIFRRRHGDPAHSEWDAPLADVLLSVRCPVLLFLLRQHVLQSVQSTYSIPYFSFILMYQTYAESFIEDDFFMAVAFSVASVANAIARIGWGYLTDRTSFQIALSTATCLASVFLLTMPLTRGLGKMAYLFWVSDNELSANQSSSS